MSKCFLQVHSLGSYQHIIPSEHITNTHFGRKKKKTLMIAGAMESESVRRRMNMIASHFAFNSSNSLPTTHLIPMNCSGSLSSLIPRRDNRMYFARQDSASQAFFMRQGNSEKQVNSVSSKCPAANYKSNTEQPLFSRPTNMNSNLSSTDTALIKDPLPKREDILNLPSPPSFARPNTGTVTKQNLSYPSQSDGMKWRPRMDVVDSGNKYIVIVELAGVNVNNIRVEVIDQTLMIKGKRSAQSRVAYHRKEILEGSFNIVWALPFDANKDTISADFLDGFLRVNIPKF